MRPIDIGRIMARLDMYLGHNDYEAAERHLLSWLAEAQAASDTCAELLLLNECMGLYRKTARRTEAEDCAGRALALADAEGATVTAATTRINAATVSKAFGRAAEALPLFAEAREIYERHLAPTDPRLGGLYNNMALAMVDEHRFAEAAELYALAAETMRRAPDGTPELAITYLNMADAAALEHGCEAAEEQIGRLVEAAWELLDAYPCRDGRYAFVCEKCASTFGHYGYFVYEATLAERARRIYEGT